MLNKETLDKYDTQGMYKMYDRWPEIAKDAYNSDLEPVDFHDIDHIVFAGMGPLTRETWILLFDKIEENKSPIAPERYLLPKTVDKNTLHPQPWMIK